MHRRSARRDVGPAAESEQASNSAREIIRVVTGIVLIVALVGIAVLTVAAKDSGPDDPSAIQVMQVYVEGAFWAIVAIGIAFAVYVGSRGGEGE